MSRLIKIIVLSIVVIMQVNGQDFPDDFYNAEKKILKSEVLNSDRILFIYLPNDYDKDTTKTYPVHYLTDAPTTSNIYFDLLRLHSLNNKVPQSIVVGLSSDNRNYNLFPEKGAKKYLEFINKEVIPFIESNYKTNSFKALSGHSLGGNFVIYSMISRPNLFNAYIAGSPGPIETILELVDNIDSDFNISAYTYLYSSTGSLDDTDTSAFNLFKKKLSSKINDKVDFYCDIHNGENHISNIVINYQTGITKLYQDWAFVLPDKLDKPISEKLRNHYDNLESKFGYRPEINEWEVIFPTMDQLAKRGDFENAINILKYCIKIHPDSDQAYAFLARAYISMGNIDLAKENLNKSIEINPQNQFTLNLKQMLKKD